MNEFVVWLTFWLYFLVDYRRHSALTYLSIHTCKVWSLFHATSIINLRSTLLLVLLLITHTHIMQCKKSAAAIFCIRTQHPAYKYQHPILYRYSQVDYCTLCLQGLLCL